MTYEKVQRVPELRSPRSEIWRILLAVDFISKVAVPVLSVEYSLPNDFPRLSGFVLVMRLSRAGLAECSHANMITPNENNMIKNCLFRVLLPGLGLLVGLTSPIATILLDLICCGGEINCD